MLKTILASALAIVAVGGIVFLLQDQAYTRGYERGQANRDAQLSVDILTSIVRHGEIKVADSAGNEVALIVKASPTPSPE